MTVFPALFSLLRHALRGLLVLSALGVLAFATAAAVMFFWVLPNISTHRDTVADLMSRALGQRVTLEAVSGAWQQARPEFRLRGLRLHDAQGRSALYLPELEAAFAWRSLLVLEPRFNHIELQGLALDVRRGRDGHVTVGGMPLDPSDPDGGFASWLLRQGRVHLGRGTLTWHDELQGAPPLVLGAVDFTLENVRRRHRLQLSAVPPATLARPLRVDGTLRARNIEDRSTWNGHIDVVAAGVSFPQLARWIALPYPPQKGWGAVHAKLGLRQGTLAWISAGLDLREVETVLGSGLPPLRLTQARGQAVWQRGRDEERLRFENVRLARPDGEFGEPFNVGLAWGEASREFTARALGLGDWQAQLPSLPMDAALRARIARLQPQGRFDTLRLRWVGAEPGLDNFDVAARFRGLGVQAVDRRPGFANLSGRIEGNAAAGEFEIDSSQLGLELPALFREPSFVLDSLRAQGSWNRTARGRRVTLARLAFESRDAAGTAAGHYEAIPGQRGVIDLSAHLSRADGTAVYRYLPTTIGDATVDWVRRSVLAGGSDDVELTLKGDLARFPFDTGGGTFRVAARVRGGALDYVPGWPRIEGIDGRLLFEGRAMEVTSERAQIYGVALAPVKAVIPDLIHHEEVLEVDGEANGPVADFIRFANASPVGARLRGLTQALDGAGAAKLALSLRIPLRHSDDTTLAGRLNLLDATFASARVPRLESVRGTVDFTGDSLTAQNLGAQFLGGPLRLDATTRQDGVHILARGRATSGGLTAWLGPAWAGRFSGQSAWQGELVLAPAGERIRVQSNLVGLGSTLPAPLGKPAGQALALGVVSQTDGDVQRHEVRLGELVSAVWRTEDARIERGEVRFGGAAVLPPDPGLRLAGRARGLDLGGWLGLLPGDGGGGATLSTVDLGFEAIDLMGRRFHDVRLQGRSRGGLLRTQVSGRALDGTLTYRAAGEQPARVSAQFRQLTIPAPAPGGAVESDANVKATEFPTLDVSVEDFRLEARPLGRLEALVRGAPQGLLIEHLQLSHPDSVFRMSGLWRDTGAGETRADLDLEVLDAGKFLARFGYPDMIRRGTSGVRGNATWEGSPADFAFATLAGQLEFKARGGQFLKVEPGVGKLLGVLSLQSLPRRLNFDFRDIFNQGYAFDDISATLRVARGVVYSDDFRMRGPAAKVNMSGLADLNEESVQLRIRVIPKMSEGVAVAGALLGGPLAGVGALAAQKLLRDPLEEVVAQEYMVTGPWQAPDVKRLPKSTAKAEPPVPEP